MRDIVLEVCFKFIVVLSIVCLCFIVIRLNQRISKLERSEYYNQIKFEIMSGHFEGSSK